MMSTQQKTGVNIVTVENSSWHNSALDDEGRVWTWEQDNISYRIGRTTSGDVKASNYYGRGAQVTTTNEPGVNLPFILQLSGSVENTLALDRDGNVWSWGLDSEYALGRSGDRAFPGKVNLPTGVKAKWIAAAYHGGKIIDTEGNIWVWGNGSDYGLGTGAALNVSVPTMLTMDANNASLSGVKFKMITSSDYTTLCAAMALTEDGDLYTWGNSGTAAIGGSQRPKNIGNFSSLDIKKIDVSNGIFGFLTESGDIYTWGDNIWNSWGRQGHNDTLARALPKRIENVVPAVGGAIVPAPKFKDWSIYAWSMCAVDVNGTIYGCGTPEGNNKHTGVGNVFILTGYKPNGLPLDTEIFIVSEGYQQTSYVDVYGNAYVTGPPGALGNNSGDGSIPGPWVHFTGSGKPLFTVLTSDPTSEAKRYSTLPKTTLNIETNVPADEIKYVIIYPEDTDEYTDGETFYSKTFAEFEQPYYNKGTDPQLLLSPNFDLWSSRYYANPKISEEVFNAAYNMKTASDKGIMDASPGNKIFTKAGAVSNNCIVWVQSMNAYGTTRMVYRFDNYYTQTKAWMEGVKEDDLTFSLYPPELIGGGYGLFLDPSGNIIPGVPPFGYDLLQPDPKALDYWILSPTEQLLFDAYEEDGYLHRFDRSKEIFLTELSQIGDETTKTPRITFSYKKNPDMWIDADIYFVDESANSVYATINSVSVDHEYKAAFAPYNAEHIDGQDPYLPPASDNPQNKVIGYSVGDPPDGTEGSYTKCSFPDGFRPVLTTRTTIYIVYSAGMVSVVESFIDISNGGSTAIKNGDGQSTVERNLKQGTDSYSQSGPVINGYVLVGYEIAVGGAVTDTKEFLWENGEYVTENASVPLIPSDTAVKFFYKADNNGDGIPDDEAGTVQVYWFAINANDSRYRIAQKTLYGNGRWGDSVTILEDKANELPTADYDPNKWIFKPGQPGDTDPYLPEGSSGTESITFTIGDTQNVYFYYDEDFNANGTVDKLEGYFTEKYKLSSSLSELDPPQADTTAKWLGGETYYKKAPLIQGYAAVGYAIEEDGVPVKTVDRVDRELTGNVAVTYEIPFENTGKNYTVTFLYAQDADNNNIPDDEQGSVTVTWVGTTFAGNDVEIAKLVIVGYIGDDVTGSIYPPAPIDDVWKPESNTVPDQVVLSDTPQAYMYQYTEVLNFSTIMVESSSTDGNLNFSYQLVKKLTDGAFDITAFAIPTYKVTGYRLYDNYDNAAGSGVGDTVSIDPAEGSQKVVFIYESIITTVVIKAVDASDYSNVLQSLTITDAVIGQKYSATAPYVDDTWVLTSEVLQVIDVAAGTNFINFEYEKATGNVTVLLKENDTAGQIIKVTSENVTSGSTTKIPIPDLTGAYYTLISAGEESVDFTGTEPSPKIVEYYYKKVMMDVTVIAVDALDGSELKSVSYPGAARKGESYTAFALTVDWHTLTEPNSKSVYVDPAAADNTIIVSFTYKSDEVSDITVRSIYKDENNVETLLQEYTARNAVGDKFTAAADNFDGFSLIGGSAIEIVVDADSGKNVITFEYTDVRVTVDVFSQIGSDETTRQKASSDKYISGSKPAVAPPYLKNHLTVGYIIDTGKMTEVNPDSFTGFTLSDGVTDDTSIVFVYALIEDIVDSRFIDIAIKGVTGEITHYSYVKRFAKDDLPLTLKVPGDVFYVQGYVLSDTADFTVTESTAEKIFNYDSLATTVTIRMTDGTGTDVADSFAVGATTGAPFTYNAPYVSGYYLNGNSLGKVTSVLANGGSEIIFTYGKITSNVTMIAKENDENGRVIGVFQVDDPMKGTNAYDVPDLTADFYTAKAMTVSISYDGVNSVSADVYYTKDTASVEIRAVDYVSDEDLGAQIPLVNQRKGEAVSVKAPNVTNYVLVGNSTQIVIADGITKAVFKYRSLESDEVVVKALDSAGNILQSYTLKGSAGETVWAEPPTILGWKTSDTADSAKIGTNSEIIFNYTKNVVTVTIKTVDYEGPQLGSVDVETAKGDNYTAYAPHIPGYVVYGSASYTLPNLAANETVTFVYKTIASVVDEYTVTITIIGKCADDELYKDSFIRPNNSGNYDVDALDVAEYNLISATPVSVNVVDEDKTIIFNYESIYTTVAIYMADEDSDDFPAIFNVRAVTGESFTFNAPSIVGYSLTSPPSGSVPVVLPNGASRITFTYRKSE